MDSNRQLSVLQKRRFFFEGDIYFVRVSGNGANAVYYIDKCEGPFLEIARRRSDPHYDPQVAFTQQYSFEDVLDAASLLPQFSTREFERVWKESPATKERTFPADWHNGCKMEIYRFRAR